MFMGEGLDTGDMLLKAETPVGENETSGELFERLCHCLLYTSWNMRNIAESITERQALKLWIGLKRAET